MKIALIGYGKMGKEVEKSALARGHDILLRLSSSDMEAFDPAELAGADVAIEFTRPDAAVRNITMCFNQKVPMVTGTTGWYDHLEEIKSACLSTGQSFIFASNFSIGVNMLFEVNRKLAALMNKQPFYRVLIEEIHHSSKVDAPSGTAITLANDLVSSIDRLQRWIPAEGSVTDYAATDSDKLPVFSERTGLVPGTHVVRYTSDNDQVEIRHDAFNRKGFAEGAVIAAEWLIGKKGFFTMKDVLKAD